MRKTTISESDILIAPSLRGVKAIQAGKGVDTVLSDLIDLYLETMFGGRAASTLTAHRLGLRDFKRFVFRKDWINRENSTLNLRVYAQWVQHCFATSNGGYAQLKCSVTRCFVKWLWRNEHIQYVNLENSIRMPKAKDIQQRPCFTYDEYKRMLEAAQRYRYGQMVWPIVCAWHTGMAASDVCFLKWASVDLESLTITYARLKTGRIITVPIMPGSDLHLALKQKAMMPKEDDYPNDPENGVYFVDTLMASTYQLKLLTQTMRFNIWFSDVRDMAGVSKKKTFHSFRATFASMCANGGMSTALACTMTGHKSPDVFKRYVTTDIAHARTQLTAAYTAYHGINPTITLTTNPEPKQLTQ